MKELLTNNTTTPIEVLTPNSPAMNNLFRETVKYQLGPKSTPHFTGRHILPNQEADPEVRHQHPLLDKDNSLSAKIRCRTTLAAKKTNSGPAGLKVQESYNIIESAYYYNQL